MRRSSNEERRFLHKVKTYTNTRKKPKKRAGKILEPKELAAFFLSVSLISPSTLEATYRAGYLNIMRGCLTSMSDSLVSLSELCLDGYNLSGLIGDSFVIARSMT